MDLARRPGAWFGKTGLHGELLFVGLAQLLRHGTGRAAAHHVLLDLRHRHDSHDGVGEEYFLGSIVLVTGGETNVLLDGQQRLASATILLSVLRDARQGQDFLHLRRPLARGDPQHGAEEFASRRQDHGGTGPRPLLLSLIQ